MALADAIADMQAFAARGRIGGAPLPPRLFLALTGRVERGGDAYVEWDVVRARDPVIVIDAGREGPVVLQVPASGRRLLPPLPVGRHRVVLRAEAWQGGHARVVEESAEIEVVVPRPRITIDYPRRIMIGEPLRVRWNIEDAERIELEAPDGARRVDGQGEIDLRPAGCGPLALTWRAQGAGGRAHRRVRIDVVAPPVVVDVPARVTVEAGDNLVIGYSVAGAASLVLHSRDDGDRPRVIPFAGRIEIDALCEPEHLMLVATGHDGRVRRKHVAIDVMPMRMPSIDEFLAILNGGIDG